MKRLTAAGAAILTCVSLAACGSAQSDTPSASTPAPAPKKTWTVGGVEREYNDQLNTDLADDTSFDEYTDYGSSTSVDTSCLLESGNEGKRGTLLCHLDYTDGDRSTVEIVVRPDGYWIAHSV